MTITYLEDELEPLLEGMIRVEPLRHLYSMPENIEKQIRSVKYHFGYGVFGESVFNRTYSRIKKDGTKETFPDVIVRVVNGNISIRKNWYILHGLEWNEEYWNNIALKMGTIFMEMKALPPGRGLWTCGTDFGNTKGASAFNNCGFCSPDQGLVKSASWTMNALMSGCGIGFDTEFTNEFDNAYIPGCELCSYNFSSECSCKKIVYAIHDSREGWVKSVNLLLKSYLNQLDDRYVVHFDYSKLREKGTPIKGFGGTASGAAPLHELHQRIRALFDCYIETKTNPRNSIQYSVKMTERFRDLLHSSSQYMISLANNAIEKISQMETRSFSEVMLICGVFNCIGICVVAGNVRRSSEICLGRAGCEEFMNLKNYELYPERAMIGWMSNNSVVLKTPDDFEFLPQIAEKIKVNGEPGVINMVNIRSSGRVGSRHPIGRECEPDIANGINPCGEIPLENFEYCNLSEVFPTRCNSDEELIEAARIATIYSSTVSLLPSDSSDTNRVVAKNRRIGISISGIAEFYHEKSFCKMIGIFKKMYKTIRLENQQLAIEAGVVPAIRVTTVKPSGTISQLVGVSSGIHFPIYQYCIRRMRIDNKSDTLKILEKAGYKTEPELHSPETTTVVEIPLHQSDSRTSDCVLMWEQSQLQQAMQRHFSDNSVSCTIYFNPKTESEDLERCISTLVPNIKSVSVLPHTDQGEYEQMPYEKITKERYEELTKEVKHAEWENSKEDAELVKGCDGGMCSIEFVKSRRTKKE